MTVVAVKKQNGIVSIASDDATTSGYTTISNADNKSFTKLKQIGKYTIAGSGLTSITSLLFMYAKTHLIRENSEEGVLDWFKGFLDWRKEKTGEYGISSNNFIIVWDNKIYEFQDFQVTEIRENYAIGSGRDFALAAMYMGASAKKAVECAINFDSYCSAPVHFFNCIGGKT
ncbi:MAG: hypothetical protein CMP22_07740 [Rickettsiales bacterium]|nr:hypothetical protein [Rickettsiales bacterium]|tara:strand:- start:67 stop:582 length:516 start_codon:yes stop_codon:yes gene_type:complete